MLSIMYRIKRPVVSMIIVIMLTSMFIGGMSTSYAAPEDKIRPEDLRGTEEYDREKEDTERGSKEKEDTDKDGSNKEFKDIENKIMDDFYFDEDTFNNMLDILMGNESGFVKYTEDKTIESTVPHSTMFSSTETSDKEGNEYVELNDKFLTLKYDMFHNEKMYSHYIKTGKTEWYSKFVTSGKELLYRKYMKNLLAYGNKDNYTASKSSLQVDSYGNYITNNRQVVTPFFMQEDFTVKVLKNIAKDDPGRLPDAIAKNPEKYTFIPFKLNSDQIEKLGKHISTGLLPDLKNPMIRAFYIDSGGNIVDVSSKLDSKDGAVDAKKLLGWNGQENMGGSISESQTKRFIEENYKDIVQDHNKHFIDTALELIDVEGRTNRHKSYIGNTNLGELDLVNDAKAEHSALLENLLLTILQGGFGRLLQLTIAFTVADVYEEMFINFSSKYIFHTADYTESSIFVNLFGAYVVFIIIIISLNLLISVISILRGRTTMGKIIMRVGLALLITTIPIKIYNTIVVKGFNEWPSGITRNEIKQIMLLDRWASLSETGYSNIDKGKIPFTIDRDFRGSQYNYLVKFQTNQFVNDKNRRLEESYLALKDYSTEDYSEEGNAHFIKSEMSKSKDKRVSVMVDANNLIDYFKDTNSGDNLFEYLVMNDAVGNYEGLTNGIREYTEYEMYIDERDKISKKNIVGILDKDKIGDGTGSVKSSDIGKKLYNYYAENGGELYEKLRVVTELLNRYELTNDKRERIINQLSSVPIVSTKQYYESITQDDFNTEMDYEIFTIEKNILETSDYGDIAGVYDFLKEISNITDDIPSGNSVDDAVRLYENELARNITAEINRKVIEDFMDMSVAIKSNLGSSIIEEEALTKAVEDILMLNMYFELTNKLGNTNFPLGIEDTKVEGDVYIRSLVVPLKEMTPSNVAVENAALYVGASKSGITVMAFIAMILIVAAYGLMKLIVISTLLLPILMGLMIYNYLIQENYENKVVFGALYILGVFLAVHWGFLGVWKFTSVKMNSGLANLAVGGRASFFNTLTNSVVVIIYFILTIKYMLYPTMKTAITNPGDLGGSIQMSKVQAFGDKIAGKLGNSAAGGNIKEAFGMDRVNQSEREKLREERRLEALKKDKEIADKARIGSDDTSKDIDKRVEDKIKGDNLEVSEELKEEKGGNIFKYTKGIDDEINSDKPNKEKLERLKKNNIFKSKVDTKKVDGSSSNKIKIKKSALAGSVNDFMKGAGIDTIMDDKGNIHMDASEKDIKSKEKDLKKHLDKAKKGLDIVKTEEGKTVANAHKTETLSFENNPYFDEELDDLEVRGEIGRSYIENDDGSETVEISGNKESLEKVKRIVKDSLIEESIQSMVTSSSIRVDDNIATRQALVELGVKDITEITEDGRDFIEINKLPEGYKEKEFIKTIEEVSIDLNDVQSLGVAENSYVKLSSGNIIVKDSISKSGLTYGEDYIEEDGLYKSLTENGSEIMQEIGINAENEKAEMIKSIDSLSDIKISRSEMFIESSKNTGVRHEITNLAYDSGQIMSTINEIKRSKSTDNNVQEMREILTGAIDVNADGDKIVMYTDKEINSEIIESVMNDLQQYRKTEDDNKELKKKEEAKRKEKEKDKGKEDEAKKVAEIIKLMQEGKSKEIKKEDVEVE